MPNLFKIWALQKYSQEMIGNSSGYEPDEFIF